MRKIYLDNGSTSYPKAPGVGRAMSDYIEEVGCNIGRGGYQSSYSLAERILATREKLCGLFSFDKESNVIFTPNVTYSLNFLVSGLLRPGDNVIITSMEHNAVARPVESAKMRGVSVSIVQCDTEGRLNVSELENLIRPETKAVVMLHGSNVCGTLMPVADAGAICEKHGVFFIVDSAQTAGVFTIDMKKMKIDGLAFTGHKGLLGPQGIGGFLVRDELAKEISPLIHGGTGSVSDSVIMPEFLPDRFEPGTLNLPGILGLSAALDYITEIGIDAIREAELKLTGMFIEAVGNREDIGLPDLQVFRKDVHSIDRFSGTDNAEVAYRLDENTVL